MTGWQDYVITDAGERAMQVLPDGISPGIAIGILGVTGMTAYFGITDVGQIAAGDVVVISAAGAPPVRQRARSPRSRARRRSSASRAAPRSARTSSTNSASTRRSTTRTRTS